MKYIIVFIHALAIAIYQLFFGDPVSVAAKIPDNIEAGKDFVIEVTVNKSQVTGFAKLQLEIPAAFVATEVDSKSGSFTASGRIVKIIWTSVPGDAELVVKINVSVPATATGDKQIKGKFSYIDNNVKQEAEFPELNFKLAGDANAEVAAVQPPAAEPVATTEPVATGTSAPDTTTQAFSKPNEPDASVSVSRKISSSGSPDNFLVDVIIKKGNVKGFAKLSEKIPAGYKAEQASIAGASFAFENGEAKFIWTSIPATEEIKVSYNLIPDASASIQKPAYIEGSRFSYLESDQTKKIMLDKQEITDGESAAAIATTTPPANTNTQPDNTAAAQPDVTATKQPDVVANTTEPAATNTNEATTTASVPKNGNIHYSVQIGAFQKSVNASALGRRFGIKETVKTEMQDGFTKCILGKYNEYKVARDNRETFKDKGVTDAFVTAYNSGKRITVQEALMVSNQKWYK